MTNREITINTALRLLGNKKSFTWDSVVDSLYGVTYLAINLDCDSQMLSNIRFAAIHLSIEDMNNEIEAKRQA